MPITDAVFIFSKTLDILFEFWMHHATTSAKAVNEPNYKLS